MRFLSLILLSLWMGASAPAEAQTAQPLKGRVVGIYLSSRGFSYDDHYFKMLDQFVQIADSEKALPDDLKLRTLISVGRLLAQQLKAQTGADSVYFLNENTRRALAFQAAYSPNEGQLPALEGFEGTDFILSFSEWVLGTYKTNSVYSHSNKLVTRQVVHRTARLRAELWEPHSGLMRGLVTACVDERDSPAEGGPWFDFHNASSETGLFLARCMTRSVALLQSGQESDCNFE